MMKRFKLTYALAFVAALSLLTACSSDDAANGGETPILKDGPIKVHLRVSAAGSGTMRAWQDNENATDAEMMNVWTVVAVHDEGTNANKVAAIYACKPTGEPDREIDQIAELPNAGKYRFYSFANMSPKVVMHLLGINGTGAASNMRDGNEPDPTTSGGNDGGNESDDSDDATGTVTSYDGYNGNDNYINDLESIDKLVDIAFDDGETVTADDANAVTVNMAGNLFDINAASNGYGATGIPMSNVQTKTVSDGSNVDLIVVRMMAKIELQIKNSTGASVTVKSATLSNVTKNKDGNLKLLPKMTVGQNTMDFVHGDIQPNLGTALQADLPVAVNKTIVNGKTETVDFYINECATPTNLEGLFYLTLEMDNSGTSEYRYAMISNESSEWNYIGRNDYRIIPLELDDLKFEIIPYDFPAIGVYPVSVKEVDATNHVYDFEFHDYGHFHLLPSVTKSGTPVEFSATTPTGSDYQWTLIDNDWDKSWFTYAARGDAAQTANPNSFYRTGSGSITIDGDDEGQTPVWYANTTGSPQWDPAASATYRPFIFGYIADPGSATKKQVYHEMKIQVYNGTTAYRQMLYRFYMTLSADQMLYSRMFGAPRVRHTHGY